MICIKLSKTLFNRQALLGTNKHIYGCSIINITFEIEDEFMVVTVTSDINYSQYNTRQMKKN
jgi:hypothetical protein